MQPSSPSRSHFTQLPIKVQHKIAKTRQQRRRRVDLTCGCSVFIHINCANNGFSHRGKHHCSSSREWRTYLGDTKSPIFQNHRTPPETNANGHRHHKDKDPVQLQPQESTGDSPMFLDLDSLDSFTTSDIAFLEGL
ncbi:AC2 protein [Conyza yellow vein virus]|nr:AC2 protein [Conyza yellow vein virus]UED37343.1 AC2 protein [Conyza yellow vein virus]